MRIQLRDCSAVFLFGLMQVAEMVRDTVNCIPMLTTNDDFIFWVPVQYLSYVLDSYLSFVNTLFYCSAFLSVAVYLRRSYWTPVRYHCATVTSRFDHAANTGFYNLKVKMSTVSIITSDLRNFERLSSHFQDSGESGLHSLDSIV